jgi:integrase
MRINVHTKPEGTRVADIGRAEPGFARFAQVRRIAGTSEEAIEQYAKFIGAARRLAPRDLLDLTVAEIETLDAALLGISSTVRTVLKMYFRAHKRQDLLDALPKQRRQKKRRASLEDVLTPDNVQALIAQASSLRDRAILATLAATGARINEVLGAQLKDLRATNGSAYQLWFGATKTRGQERYSPKIEGVWKRHLDAWLEKHPRRADHEAILFPSTVTGGKMADSNANVAFRGLARKAGITKAVNPHAFRHARVTWGVMNGEDLARLSLAIWGKAVSAMLNRYNHYAGLEATLAGPTEIEMKNVPAMPVPPVLATTARVQQLEMQLDFQRKRMDAVLEAIRISGLPGLEPDEEA